MKCYLCDKETDYKTRLIKYADIKNIETGEKIKCLCWECENEVIKMWKKQWENKNE